jgi:pimeloyl-ACP methyl ester carboxylesterase
VGEVLSGRLPDSDPLDYLCYVPRRLRVGAPPLVLVHGISRNVREVVEAFAPAAERLGWLLVAPHFDRDHYDDYQRLGRSGRGLRADRALERLLVRVLESHPGLCTRIHLFGYSGGAQFAHRYLMAAPDRVAAAVCASAGWYTFPDPGRQYPYGLRLGRSLPAVRMRARDFGRVPIRVLVGSRDVARDDSLRQSRTLAAAQGADRLERARRWVDAMNAAFPHPHHPPADLRVLEGAGHAFTESVAAGLVDETTHFLASISDRGDATEAHAGARATR